MIIYLSVDYLILVEYFILTLLALRNFWVIILKQQEYNNLPILMFYAFSLLAFSIRTVVIIWYWTPNPIIYNIDMVQQAAKLSVGVVQDWITLELAIRIHYSKGYSNISEEAKRKLRVARGVLFAVMALLFAIFCAAVIVSSHK